MDDRRKLKNLKLIVFDLDGTLLSDEGIIGEETPILITTLKRYGVGFTFASGRLHSAITSYAGQLGIKIPLISLDGSLIKSFPDGKTIYESFVNEKYVKKAVQLASKKLINIALCHGDAIFYTDQNSLIPQIIEKFGARYEEVPAYFGYYANTLEIVLAGDNLDAMKTIKKNMEFPKSFGLNTSFYKSQRHENIYYVEVRKKGASKGNGLMRLLKHVKIKPSEVAVLGDWYNDLSLFKFPVFKVALNNAIPEIKRLSNVITSRDNNKDGVAEFLEMVLKAKRES
jgi:Cof subfamily protein (haloacid dehalogenase superfamily)